MDVEDRKNQNDSTTQIQSAKMFLTDFIKQYRSFPCLWKVGSPDYNSRAKKAAAYEVLAKTLRKVDPDANRVTVVKKINSLRSSYRKEVNKYEAVRRTTSDPTKVMKPTLWYYELFSFLAEHQENENTPSSTVRDNAFSSNNDSDENFVDEVNESFESREVETEPEWLLLKDSLFPSIQPKQSRTKRKLNKQRPDQADDSDDDEPLANVRSAKLCKKEQKLEDQYDIFGRNVAIKLRMLRNKQRIFAEKLINEVLFEAEFENLHRNCSIQLS